MEQAPLGILVAGRRTRVRRAASVGGVFHAVVMLASPVAGGVSAVARAVVEVARAAVMFSGNDECR